MKRCAWSALRATSLPALLLTLLLFPSQLPALPAQLEHFFQAIRQRESAGHPWSIFDNTVQRSYRLASRAEAERVAAALIERGHSVDLGLFQVNWRWHRHRPGLTLANVFDPAVNESVARTIFSEFYAASRAAHADADEAIRMAVGAYNNGKVRRHNPKYVNGVYRLARLPPPYADEHDGTQLAAAPGAAIAERAAPPIGREDRDAGTELARWFNGIPSLAALLNADDANASSDFSLAEGVALMVVILLVLLALALIVLLKLASVLAASAAVMAKRVAVAAALGAGRRFSAQVNQNARLR